MLANICASGFGVVLGELQQGMHRRRLLCVSGQSVENKGSCKSCSRHFAGQGLT